jgi:hypothetical protein
MIDIALPGDPWFGVSAGTLRRWITAHLSEGAYDHASRLSGLVHTAEVV